jgi:hypothetical protein
MGERGLRQPFYNASYDPIDLSRTIYSALSASILAYIQRLGDNNATRVYARDVGGCVGKTKVGNARASLAILLGPPRCGPCAHPTNANYVKASHQHQANAQ